jgi:hypothetical protein
MCPTAEGRHLIEEFEVLLSKEVMEIAGFQKRLKSYTDVQVAAYFKD